MAGVILILMGLAKLGTLVKFIPYPVTTGFTTGIAVIIFTSQIRDLFGLTINYVNEKGALRPQSALRFPFRLARAAASQCTRSTGWPPPLALARCWFWPACADMSRAFPVRLSSWFSARACIGPSILVSTHRPIGGIETLGTRFGGIPSMLPRAASADQNLKLE